MRTKRPFSMNYRTYEGAVGTAADWRAAFAATMGLGEAEQVMGDRSPWGILGLQRGAVWPEVQSAFRAGALACHPDRCAQHGLTEAVATERFKALVAAFTVLKNRLAK